MVNILTSFIQLDCEDDVDAIEESSRYGCGAADYVPGKVVSVMDDPWCDLGFSDNHEENNTKRRDPMPEKGDVKRIKTES